MSISNPPKLQLCLYPHLSNHFMANSKPSILCFFGLFFLRKLCLFPKVFFQPIIYVYVPMAISKLSFFWQLWPFPYAVLHRPLSNATYLDNLLLARVMVDRESIPLVGCKQKPELLACKSLKLAILGSSRSRVHRRCHLRRSHLASQGCNWARASCRHSWSHHSPFKWENKSKILFNVFLWNRRIHALVLESRSSDFFNTHWEKK